MAEQDLNFVPGKSHYSMKYIVGGRLFSYAHQMNTVLAHEPRAILEIGPGPGMVTAALRAIDIEVTTVDVQAELNPDVVASVTNLPFENGSFDVSMCCQVLEHLPFEQFVPALEELCRVSRKVVLVSLPDTRPRYDISFKVPLLKRVEVQLSRAKKITKERIERSWSLSGHYWEIGYPEFGVGVIKNASKRAGLELVNNWRPLKMPYHHFFEFKSDSVGQRYHDG
jgi:SAM-dependent methyltransferase